MDAETHGMASDVPRDANYPGDTDVPACVAEQFAGSPGVDLMPVFVCPCTYDASLQNTYASVLVVGVDRVAQTLHDIRSNVLPPIANMSSYCMTCRRITPSFNPSRPAEANVLHWKRQRAFYASCAHFIGTWPKRARGTRVRHRKKKIEAFEDAVPVL